MKKGKHGIAVCMILGGMFLVSAAVLAIAAWWMLQKGMQESILQASVIITYIAAGLLGGFCMGQHMGRHKFLWGLLIGAVYYLILFLAGRAQGGHLPSEGLSIFSGAMICMVAGMLGGMLAPNAGTAGRR